VDHRPAEQADQLVDAVRTARADVEDTPEASERAAVTKASATSVTKVKSRVCLPSPTTVKGLPASFWARNTPNTAP